MFIRNGLAVVLMSVLSTTTVATTSDEITVEEIVSTQQAWGNGIVSIGRVFLDGGDVRQAATDHIQRFYDYEEGAVLFKPTLASQHPFRPTFEDALSYFVGGIYAEDGGFALKPWTNVRWENHGVVVYGTKGVTMGHYFFRDMRGEEVKVEYTIGFKKRDGQIKIFLQDSSLPYSGI